MSLMELRYVLLPDGESTTDKDEDEDKDDSKAILHST